MDPFSYFRYFFAVNEESNAMTDSLIGIIVNEVDLTFQPQMPSAPIDTEALYMEIQVRPHLKHTLLLGLCLQP
jgi:hypothetical protein